MNIHIKHSTVKKTSIVVGVILMVLLIAAYAYISREKPVNALPTQNGVQQVTLNSGGGANPDGSDGIRFTLNSQSNTTPANEYDFVYAVGQDSLAYRGTFQYCCSGGGPMLNIGGTLYGQAGPAHSPDVPSWTSIEILSTSGATTIGPRSSATGNSTATLRYTVEHNDLTYYFDRTVSYAYPNDYVTDSYVFTIPAGNTDEVKFYVGGDTAPGSSDSGYGIMLESPVRSVISLNTSSQIMFGFREVQGSRPFDGATSQQYGNPYPIVEAGGDIGFYVRSNNHDAGLMMQWNLGATPGAYEGRFQQFATQQGTNLNAAFAENEVEVGEPVDLNISIVNSLLSSQSGLGYTFTLPSGLVIADTPISSCGGTLTVVDGTESIVLSSVELAGATNCVVTISVLSLDGGVYTITAANATDIEGPLNNNIGTSSLSIGVYTIGFIAPGGTTPADIIDEDGAVFALPSSTRTGYTLTGWNTQSDGSGTAYAANGNYTINGSSATLYAQWTAIPYDVTFDEQGGDVVADFTDRTYLDVVELPETEREGYRFMGWNTAANGSGDLYSSNGEDNDLNFTVPATNTTLYAQWAQLYTITFVAQGGSSVSPVEFIEEEEVYLDNSDRDGYTILEWNTAADGSGDAYEAGEYAYPASQDLTLYAIWGLNYEVHYVWHDDSETDYRPADREFSLRYAPYREGYGFTEWNTAADGSGDGYDQYDDFEMPAADVTFYAIWAQEHSIKMYAPGLIEDYTQVAGREFWIPYAPDREGYEFIEWNTAADGSGEGIPEDSYYTMPDHAFVLYAIWEDNDTVSSETENAGPNGGDANNDGILDSQQANVTSFVNPVTNKPVALAITSDNDCFVQTATVVPSASLASDGDYVYPYGLLDFVASCGEPGFSATVTQYFYDAPIDGFTVRKFMNGAFSAISDATIVSETIDGRQVLVATYTVIDGGPLDADGAEDGTIIDPAGPGALTPATPGAPNTGMQPKDIMGLYASVMIAATGLVVLVIASYKKLFKRTDAVRS